jgi:DNA (cytosine-5)-methyltransferase 1|tara:strand:+ start:4880 stop:6490 length:1611 start_codon:yes stop_codon:yes gene_type:complete
VKIGSLFSGIGGLDLGIERGLSDFGAETVWQVEFDEYCCSVLEKRFPKSQVINKDINEVKFEELEPIDMLIGGFPCQSFSYAGNRKGMSEEDERGMLWYQFERAISVLRPKWVVAENVRGLLTAKDDQGNKGGAFARVVSFLSDSGYSVEWQVVSAASVNASHLRERIFIVGNSEHYGLLETENRGSFGERSLSWRQIQEEQEKKHRELEGESKIVVNTKSESGLEADKQTSSISESRETWIDSRTGHGGEKPETYWEKIEQPMGITTYGFPRGLAGDLGLPNYWGYSNDNMWRTPTLADSKNDALKHATKLLQGKDKRSSGQRIQVALADQVAISEIIENPELFEQYKDHLMVRRDNLPTQEEFVDYLRTVTSAKQLFDNTEGIKKSTIEHWFRRDTSGFSYPSIEDWEIIKPYLSPLKFDKELTEVTDIEWKRDKWQTPLVSSSRPSTTRIAKGINPKGQLSENPGVYTEEYLIEPWETVPRTIENEEDRINKIKALGNAVVPACAEFVGICIANSIKFGILVFDSLYERENKK